MDHHYSEKTSLKNSYEKLLAATVAKLPFNLVWLAPNSECMDTHQTVQEPETKQT